MQALIARIDDAASPRPGLPRPGHAAFRVAGDVLAPEDREYAEMHDAFARHGGLAHDDALVQRLRRVTAQPISILARWLVDRRIVSFRWHGRTLVPTFQFDEAGMSLRAGTCEVVGELVDVFDDWELCLWFARPNTWLDGARPVERVLRDARAVHDAARADRFVVRG